MRYNQDYEILINDNAILLHFFDSLENFESNMMKFFDSEPEFLAFSSIFQNILLKYGRTIDNLLLNEKHLFEGKVWDVNLLNFFFVKHFFSQSLLKN